MLRKLYIEPTTKCNLNCSMCFRHTWFDEPLCDLSLEDLRKTLDTMPRTVETIFFGGMGEPLFHRDILQMVRLAAETGAEVELLTNGTLLSEEIIRGLIDAGLCKLWVSIDDLQTDSSIDGSGHDHAGQVLSNIRRFNRIRQQHGGGIALGITFVAMRSNVHQLGLLPFFIAQHLVDEVNVSNISPTDEASQKENALLRAGEYVHGSWQGQCPTYGPSALLRHESAGSRRRHPGIDVQAEFPPDVQWTAGNPPDGLLQIRPGGDDLPPLRRQGVPLHGIAPQWLHLDERCPPEDYPLRLRQYPGAGHR